MVLTVYDDQRNKLINSITDTVYGMWQILRKCRRVAVVTETNKVEMYNTLLSRMASVVTELQLNNSPVVNCVKHDLWYSLTEYPWSADGIIFLRARRTSGEVAVTVEQGTSKTVDNVLLRVGPCAVVTVHATTANHLSDVRLEWWYAVLREDLLAKLQEDGVNVAPRKYMP